MKWVLAIAWVLITTHVSAFDATQLAKFKALNQCDKCDLSGANFSVSAELVSSGPDLSGAKLNHAN